MKLSIKEGVSGMWHYHIGTSQSPISTLCGRPGMKTQMTLEQWRVPFGAHFTKMPSWCAHCHALWKRADDPKVLEFVKASGFVAVKEVNGILCGVRQFAYTWGVSIELGTEIHESPEQRRYCFKNKAEALQSLEKITDVDVHVSGPWIKCKGMMNGKFMDDINPVIFQT